jgi:hypothetical protein
MKRRLIFIVRFLSSPSCRRRLVNPQNILILLASAVFLSTLAWSAPIAEKTGSAANPGAANSGALLQATATPGLSSEPTRTPYPPEFLTNGRQTIGITLAGAILVLIVIIGVYTFLPKKELPG